MKTTTTDDTWIEQFTVELRLRRVRGQAIGDAIASVRELLADSGQGAEEAFGSAREYAASLDLPAMSAREHAVRSMLLPVLGLFTFLIFVLASVAWFDQAVVLISMPQLMLLAVPVLLTVMFAFPFYPRAVFRKRWLPAALFIVVGLASALAMLVAPASASAAWLIFSALPPLVGAAAVLVVLSVIGTIATVRSRDDGEIVDPLPAQDRAKRRQGGRPFLIVVNWLFPMLAVVVFAMTWAFSLLQPGLRRGKLRDVVRIPAEVCASHHDEESFRKRTAHSASAPAPSCTPHRRGCAVHEADIIDGARRVGGGQRGEEVLISMSGCSMSAMSCSECLAGDQ
ncbi:hypothetical protein [Microbacterium halotolerans]|uniref:hypothetical protein n=1 Tax=Microbacterium halotolerans TaxID=246613 RepID=UPI000E6AB2A1|nr:hypothetical protein [Microbacterium halotolerans]